MNESCLGCKFLYGNGTGYSNYTWMETYLECALDKNPNLKDVEKPFDYEIQVIDNFIPTMNSRCEFYRSGEFIVLPPDRDDDLSEYSDREQVDIILNHDHNN